MASAPAFPPYITAKVQASLQPQDAAHANVQARLFNSNPVKTAMNEISNRIRALLGIEDTQPLKKKRMGAADCSSDQINRYDQVGEEQVSASTRNKGDQDGSDWDGFSSAGSAQEEKHETSGSDYESIDYEKYDPRLAASSDDESDVKESSEGAPQQDETMRHKEPIFSNKPNNRRYSPIEDFSLSPESDNSPSSPSPPPLAQKVPAKNSSKTKSTTFLPFLANGGYWSGSDSVASDLDMGEIKGRKNRRGQQERRAIWEKKYGRNANHLKKQGKSQNRDEGWDPRRGARISDDSRGKRGRGRGGGLGGPVWTGRGGSSGATGANGDPVRSKKAKVITKSLHPSWEAAKKKKDEDKTVAFAGKKIVF